jgi:diguanylate cyclase (GGDEF)-like protein
MLATFKPDDEEGRLLALQRLEVLDSPEEEPFEKIVSLVEQILHVPMCAVSLVDRHRQWFKARRGLGVCETARDISFCTHAIGQSGPFVIRDALQDERFVANPLVTSAPFIRSYAGVPLMTSDGYNVGTLCAIDMVPREFPKHEILMLENFAKVILDELELRQIASTDQLSGALSRRAFLEHATSEVMRAQRYDRPLSLAIMDLDKFKAINDGYGHPAGDRVIQRIASLCMSTIRQSDLFGRIGGEEFALLLPETSTEDAKRLAEKIRILFADEVIDVGEPIRATVSIGISGLMPEETLATLTDHADRALYMAKSEGRNRTCVGGSIDAMAAATAQSVHQATFYRLAKSG